MDRRAFIKRLSLIGVGLGWGGSSVSAGWIPTPRRRCCVVGSADRTPLYQNALRRSPAGLTELVEIMEVGPDTLSALETHWARKSVDTVILAAPWEVGHAYVASAFRAGCDVIAELDGTPGLQELRRVLEAWKSSGRSFQFAALDCALPSNIRVKTLLADGFVGELLSVDFNSWGARLGASGLDHSDADSGWAGAELLRHFELLRGWIGAAPARLQLGPARRSAAVNTLRVSYENGVMACYSRRPSNLLGAGYRVAFNGTRGRLEHAVRGLCGRRGPDDRANVYSLSHNQSETRLFPLRGPAGELETDSTSLASCEARMIAELLGARETPRPQNPWTNEAGTVASTMKLVLATHYVGAERSGIEIET